MPPAVFVGLTTIDLIYCVERVPTSNSKIVAEKQLIVAGGPATNAAVACSHLGGEARLVSTFGQHAARNLVASDLERPRLQLSDLTPGLLEPTPEARRSYPAAGEDGSPPRFCDVQFNPPTLSTILVTRATGERTVVSVNAAGRQIPQSAWDADVLQGAQCLLVDGHHMEVCIEAARQANMLQVPVVFDGGSWKQGTEELLPFVDIAICSEDFHVPDGATLPTLARLGVPRCAITRGAAAIEAVEDGEPFQLPIQTVAVADTLGAGDIFHGAFCYFFMQTQDFRQALAEAARVATISCVTFGPRAWMAQAGCRAT